MVGVAQLVEPRIVIPVVVGSSPIVHPKFFAAPAYLKVRVECRFIETEFCCHSHLFRAVYICILLN